MATGTLVRQLPGLLYVAYSPDGKLVATATGTISKRKTELRLTLMDATTGAEVHSMATGVEATFSPDGKVIATLSRGALEIWSVETGSLLRRTNAHDATSLALTPDGKRAATGASDATVAIWDLR
jgi:WD40 repeat protein